MEYPHLEELKKEIEKVAYDSKEYWRLRCNYLEKSLDPTYSQAERNNCDRFHRMLKYKQQNT